MSNETKAAPAVPQGLPAFDELDDEVVDAACTVGSLYRVDLMFAYERIRAMLAATPATLAAPSQEPVTAALRDLVAAVQKEMSPDWICSSYHPHLHSALDTAIAALREKGQV